MSEAEAKFDQWAIVELMGHRKLAARVTEATWPPGWMRLDIPGKDGTFATQFYSPAAGYGMTPVSEELARQFAQNHQPVPIAVYELPAHRASDTYDPLGDEPDDEDVL